MTLTKRDENGMRVLVAEGIIDSDRCPTGSSARSKATRQFGEVWLRSRGGDARAGNLAARSFAGLGTDNSHPQRLDVLFGLQLRFHGRRRSASSIRAACSWCTCSPTRAIAKASSSPRKKAPPRPCGLIAEIEQDSALLASEDNDFLIRMGVSRDLLTQVMYKQQAVKSDENPTTRYCLSPAEVVEYNVGETQVRPG
jgi:hypothetical protein